MRPIMIASNNAHKIKEFSDLFLEHIPKKARIIQPSDVLTKPIDVIEDGTSFVANAEKKARAFFKAGYMACFSDDSGLEIDALGGQPGIYSARFAGENATDADNRKKVIEELSKLKLNKYTARFRCVIYYIDDTNLPYIANGICEGEIILEERGENGFGYDPIFIPQGYDKTFAEISAEEKGKISHRGKAAMMFINYLDKSCLKMMM